MNKDSDDKVICKTPTPGKNPTRIDRWKYDMVREAILKSLPDNGQGVTFQELPGLVEEFIGQRDMKRIGSVMWHTTTVKLDLETTGEIRRVPKSSPQRLVRTK